MCLRIDEAVARLHFSFWERRGLGYLRKLIPEFNPAFLGGQEDSRDYWWARDNITAREKAFEKLINVYEYKALEDEN